MVEVYGADWCGDTQRTRRHLDRLGVAYRYINVEQDLQASAWVMQQHGGKERKPAVKVEAQVLAEPSDEALEEAAAAAQQAEEEAAASALPSAGSGGFAGGSSAPWAALVSVVLLSLGGAAVFAARGNH